ncbi:MAG TPA: hybrid sensor histidine kinase/response regulator [Rhodospirillaceae bacterium]|nr:hybrid sensor histidine kinase/response regulator [Rhodospirillaceae bacterium]|tara:strand:+ start:25853 stop:28660 length:2808 start_codon:yes stop_codon:yes gene_type:complete
MDDLIAEFLTETNEGLEELDMDLVNLEQNPNDTELLGKIFRLMHTIKGTCGFLGLPRLEKVAHHAENVLGRFRDGDLEVIPEYVTLIFESLDRIKEIVASIEETGAEASGDDTALIAKLDAVYEGKTVAEDAPAPAEEPTQAEPETVEPAPDEPKSASGVETSGLTEGTAGIVSLEELEAAFQAAEVLPVEEIRKELEETQPDSPAIKGKEEAKTPDAPTANKPGKPVSAQTLRVGVDVLEDLMTMVSELVLTRNQLLQILRAQNDSDFATPLQRLNQIVSELQEGVMKTRMQPIGNAWAKLPRIIRDLSIELGKKIELEMIGQDTELDRQVLELIKDPLTHMVRNSADHGIEMPEDRQMAQKPETGKIVLNAFHEGGHIIIEITDDGRGLPVNKIKSKIIANGLATEEELSGMTDQQIQKFIFKPGFSTAAEVTAVSGRGVGMDVVRTNIEKIGGTIDLVSTEGKGSVFTIKIPLTLAIVSALIVESVGERFAIPQLTVRELVMTSAHGESQIETINGSPVFRLRDRLLPLVYLDKVLGMQGLTEAPSNDSDDSQPDQARQQYIVVSQIGSYQFGIIVDRVFDTEEIVVKPVSKILRDIEIFSGNTILGDGSVVMILDSAGIARISGETDNTDTLATTDSEQTSTLDKEIPLLLFTVGDNAPKAVPLSLVSRLENIDGSAVEKASGQMVVQYRDQLMSLVPFDPSYAIDTSKELSVLVFSDKSRTLGIVVDKILDITEAAINIQHEANKPNLMGSAVIQGKTTDVVDVGYYLSNNNKNWFADHPTDVPFGDDDTDAPSSQKTYNGRRKVLLVDDSPFFRNMLTPLLNIAGYDVTPLESAEDALEMCDHGHHFDIIISDIEMPDMNGFEFAEKVRSNPSLQNTPMLALSSHATEQDIARGKQVGFNDYVAKFDRDTLLNTISQTLTSDQSMKEDI